MRRFERPRRRLHGVVGLLALFWAVLPGAAAAADPPVIRIGFAELGIGGRQFSFGTSFAVAHVQHLLEQELAADGIAVQYTFYKGAGPAVNEALSNDQLDFALQGDLPSILGRAAGLKTRLLMATIARGNTYVVVSKDSPIRSIADLRGHTMIDFKGTALQLSAARLLGTAGLAESDVKLINFDLGSANAALATGQVDGGFATILSLMLQDQGLVQVIDGSKGRSPDFAFHAHLLVTDAFAERYPALVDRVVKVAVQGAHWASEPANRQAVFEIWAKSGVPVKIYEEDYRGDELATRLDPLFDPYLTEQYHRAAADALRFGLIRAPVDVDHWIDHGPLERALAASHLENYWPAYDQDGVTPAPK
jgi:sulfonate transport system substrate-binding protein